MRVAKFSRTLLLLALPAVPAACALAQEHPNVQPLTVRDQLTKQAPVASKSQTVAPPAKAPAPAKSAQAPAKPTTQAPAKAAAQAPAKPATQAPAKAAAQASTKPATEKSAKPPVEKPDDAKGSAARRDPFETLLNNNKSNNAPPQNLPPGKAGLVVGTLRINGIVRGSGGVIAIVSNPQQRVYFLREGDKLYDGSVEHITLEAITFQEFGKDAFGKPLEREVTKRLYPSPGEQQ